MPREDRERERRPKRYEEGTTEFPTNVDPRRMPDYKPPVPSVEDSPVNDYRTRKQRYQESLGVEGRKQFRRGLNENWDRIARAFLTGTPLEQLIERFGEGGGPREGRNSVAWDQWTKGLNPGLQRAIRSRDMTANMIRTGGLTEWPPGSGRYFNDPGNDPSKREWFNQFGDRIPGASSEGPVLDYSQINQNTGTIAQYLAGLGSQPSGQPAPGEITSGGVTYNPTPTTKPTPTPVGPPLQTPSINQRMPPSYLTGSPSQSQPWHSNVPTRPQTSPYSQNYSPLSRNPRGPQYNRKPMQWRF